MLSQRHSKKSLFVPITFNNESPIIILDTRLLIDLVLNQASTLCCLMWIKWVSVMRKALLLIKVILLLTAFMGLSNIHAAEFGGKSFLATSICDLHANSSNQQTGSDDDDVTISESHFLSSGSLALLTDGYAFASSSAMASRPFARAPPSTL